ncbi:zinc-ribbon domain-containing protein [Schlegelella sp. S2-27]|uniref:Zinc-ribbon domain-containing protein n=1 Tax=Caldimonas mangrovi TaxID=2944811 RepID=A0ABT0YWB2_9BURK|nr:zinc-ribbon domain-containing protein [Caldimonas mangrovi]MCM5682609.1 zinc-ribbon domain-containing protein [Caldimonas mangrovi]
MSLICPKCGTDNRDKAKFCRGCGASLAGVAADAPAPVEPPAAVATTPLKPCPACGTPNEASALQCRVCGLPMNPQAPAPAGSDVDLLLGLGNTAPTPLDDATVVASAPLPPVPPPPPPPAVPAVDPLSVLPPVEASPPAPPPPADAPASFMDQPPPSERKAPLMLVGLVAAGVLAGAGAWWLLQSNKPQEPMVEAAPPAPMAAPAPAPAPTPEPAPAPAAMPPVVAEPTPEPASAPAEMTAAPANPLGALSAEDEAAAKKAKDEERAKARAEARARAKAKADAEARDRAEAAARAAAARKPEPPKPAFVPPPAPAAASAAPAVPADVCGGRVFIALLSCLKSECQDPVKARHPKCVDFLEAERRRERQNQLR